MGGDKSGLNKQIGELQVSLALKHDHIEEAESADIEAKEQLEELEEMITAAKADLAEHESSLIAAKEALTTSKKAFAETEAIEKEIRESLENSGAANAALSTALLEANSVLNRAENLST